MPGTFSKANRPKRPGAYVNFDVGTVAQVIPAQGPTAAILFTHDWGPSNQVVRVNSFQEFQAVYGPSDNTQGYRAVKQAFQGEGLPGVGGAGSVLALRVAASAKAKATRILQNTTPATAVTLTARYDGTYGNNLKATVQDYASNASYSELILKLGTVEVERYLFLDADQNGLAADINANSKWVTAAVNINGVAMKADGTTIDLAFTGGNDGSTLAIGDYTAAWALLEVERFAVLAHADLTDTPTVASLKAWADGQNAIGRRFRVVIGGAAGEGASTANTRSTTQNDPVIINLGIGTYTDATLGSGGTALDISTAQLAPRLAGILCARGEGQSATFARLFGLTIKVGPTQSEILTAFDAGTTVISRDSHATAPTRIEKALTTYTTKTDATKPYLIFRNPKFVGTMMGIENDLTQIAEEKFIGKLPVNDKSREFLVAQGKLLCDARVQTNAIQEAYTVAIDRDPPPSDDDEFIGVAIGLRFGRTGEQIFYTVKVG